MLYGTATDDFGIPSHTERKHPGGSHHRASTWGFVITLIRDCRGLIAEAECTAIYMENRSFCIAGCLQNRAPTWGMAGFDLPFDAMSLMCFWSWCLLN